MALNPRHDMRKQRLKLALDQNFPALILNAVTLLPEVEISPIHKINPRLSDLDDRKLLIALHQLGWHGLITNNYKMLRVPAEIAAIVKTKLAVFAVEGIGDDPLRATGAVLLHLPSVAKQIQTGKAQVFRINPRAPQPEDAWEGRSAYPRLEQTPFDIQYELKFVVPMGHVSYDHDGGPIVGVSGDFLGPLGPLGLMVGVSGTSSAGGPSGSWSTSAPTTSCRDRLGEAEHPVRVVAPAQLAQPRQVRAV
jgi:hypothetical protein